jgi:hypothetical protein
MEIGFDRRAKADSHRSPRSLFRRFNSGIRQSIARESMTDIIVDNFVALLARIPREYFTDADDAIYDSLDARGDHASQ